MKTKIIHFTAILFAVVTLSPAAFAGVAYWQSFGQKLKSSTYTQFVLNERCKVDSCCAKKTVANGFGGGRTAQPAFKRVVTCDKTCTIPVEHQRPVCRKGLRA